MRRERRNDEKPIQPLVQINDQNNLVEEEIDEEYVENPKYIHLLQEENKTMHLNKNDYEDSLDIKRPTLKNESNEEVFFSTQ
jgi:hypothetical protein